jgi:pyrroline-5-carboxylate reductase
MTTKHIVFIGGGNMTRAILGGLTATNAVAGDRPHAVSSIGGSTQ